MFFALLLQAAEVDTSAPHRSVDLTVTTTQNRDDLTLCAARVLKGAPIVLSSKTVIDFRMDTLFGQARSAYFSLAITDQGSSRLISAEYRHPYTEKLATTILRNVAKKCFASDFNTALAAHPVDAKPI